MSNRKEHQKTSLGVSDYTWSSDDDDDMPQPNQRLQDPKQILYQGLNAPRDNRQSLVGAHSSSEETSPTAARRNQTNKDRDFFWSIINNTPRTSHSHVARREPEVLTPLWRNININPVEDFLISVDQPPTIDFKNLSRSLQNLDQSLATSNTAVPTSSYLVPRVSAEVAAPHSRPLPSVGDAAPHCSRNIPPTRHNAHNFSRTTNLGYNFAPYPRNAPKQRAYPYPRSAAATSHSAHNHLRSADSIRHPGHMHARAGVVAGNAAFPMSRNATSATHHVPPSLWARASTSRVAPYSSWSTGSTNHAGPSSSWPRASTSQAGPPSSWPRSINRSAPAWNAAFMSQAAPSSSWSARPPTHATMEENTATSSRPFVDEYELAPWLRNLPVYSQTDWWGYVYRNTVKWRDPISDELIDDDLRREFNRAYQQYLRENPEMAETVEMPGANQDTSENVAGPSNADSQQPAPPIMLKPEPRDETNENPEQENADADVSSHNTESVRLTEEVVELAITNETENVAPPPTDGEEALESSGAESNTNAAAVTAEENIELPEAGPSHQGLNRPRMSVDGERDPFTVNDFNQKLLRLLECPVCLEWIEPPISQCRRGHLVCCRCRTRLNACPVCRTPFSSVRNRAMEGLAEMLRYPCRHGCGREVRLRRRSPHEASCSSRRYQCPAPDCTRHPPLPREELIYHIQWKHLDLLKVGHKLKFSIKVNSEQHETWLIMALDEYFHLRIDADMRTSGVALYVAYIGPKKKADNFFYEVTVKGQFNSRRLVYTRTTHSDIESPSTNVRHDCFYLTLDQTINFLRVNYKHCPPDKFLDFDLELTKSETENDSKEDSE